MTGPHGMSTSSGSLRRLHSEVTANVTKSVRLSLAATVEYEQQGTTEAQQVWQDVAHAQGELLKFLLAPATPTASPSTQS